MPEDTPSHLPWPGEDDRAVVTAMLKDPDSQHWTKCREFIENLVHQRARNIPQYYWEDIIQEAMIKIHKSLPTFQYKCSLKTWLFGIVGSCIIDDHRKITRILKYIIPTADSHNAHEDGELNDMLNLHLSRTAEEDFMIREEARQAIAALQEYIMTHNKRERNEKLLDMFFYEGLSLKESAKAVGCSPAVAGYVVRSAQRYVREKLGYR